jgi:hypothetical protein
MAPQPYSGDFQYIDAASRRPKLAALAMHVISIWSETDCILNEMAAFFLSTDFDKATVMLQSITQASQRAVMRKLAQASLTPQDTALLEAILATTKASEKRRHEYAHHVWAIAPQRPDSILLIDPRDLNKMLTRPTREPFRLPMQEYRESDIREDIERAQRARNLFSSFQLMIEDPARTPGGNREEQRQASAGIRARLLAEPLIQQALNKEAQRERNTPAPPQQ